LDYIELAIEVLRKEIIKLKSEHQEKEYSLEKDNIMQDIQKLSRAIIDIQKKFNI
jgi:hypothetical protein